MYNNVYDTERYSGSQLDITAKAISDPRTRLLFLDYAVRYFGILPESSQHETLAALAAFKRREYADYKPPEPPAEFDNEFHEHGYNVQKAIYDVLYWQRVQKELLPVPTGTDPSAKAQFAMRDFMFTFVRWASVFVPRISAIVEQFSHEEWLPEFYIHERLKERGCDHTIHFTPEMKNNDTVPEERVAMRRSADIVLDLYQNNISEFESSILIAMTEEKTPEGVCQVIGDDNLSLLHSAGVITDAQINMLVERAKAVIRQRSENIGLNAPHFD